MLEPKVPSRFKVNESWAAPSLTFQVRNRTSRMSMQSGSQQTMSPAPVSCSFVVRFIFKTFLK